MKYRKKTRQINKINTAKELQILNYVVHLQCFHDENIVVQCKQFSLT